MHKAFHSRTFHLKLCILKSTYGTRNSLARLLLLSFRTRWEVAALDKEGSSPHTWQTSTSSVKFVQRFLLFASRTIEIHYFAQRTETSLVLDCQQLSTFKLSEHADSLSFGFVPQGQNSFELKAKARFEKSFRILAAGCYDINERAEIALERVVLSHSPPLEATSVLLFSRLNQLKVFLHCLIVTSLVAGDHPRITLNELNRRLLS